MGGAAHQHSVPVQGGPACPEAGVGLNRWFGITVAAWTAGAPSLWRIVAHMAPLTLPMHCAVTPSRRVMLVGLGGNNGTTVLAGILANKK